MFSRIIIKYNTIDYKIVKLPIRFKKQWKSLKCYKSYNEKLNSSISRSKSKIYDYACNNSFKYFVTFTFNSIHSSEDLNYINRHFTQLLRNLQKKYNKTLKWLLIPEKHKSGKWHLHGFLNESFKNEIFINNYNYLDLRFFKKYGHVNISVIKNYEACCKYISKYITKELYQLSKGKHSYFISNNLNKSQVVYDLVTNSYNDDFDFINDYCSIKSIDLNDIDNYIDNIFDNYFYNYYNSVTSIDF